MIKKDMPLYSALKKYADKHTVRLHMPSHKGRLGFLKQAEKLDLTELGFNDNLDKPYSVIKDAQDKFAQLFGIKNAIFLTNGTSQGIFAFLAICEGKLLTQKNCHISVKRGAKLFNKQLVFLDKLNVFSVQKALKDDNEIKAVLLEYPDYFGFTPNIAEIYKVTKEHNVLLLIDSAHGAHFGLCKFLPPHAAKNCDACVVSTHKTLGSLTQTAVILSDSLNLAMQLKNSVNLLSSTSPSYILLASIDYARGFAVKHASKKLNKLFYAVNIFKKQISQTKINIIKNEDFTKLVLDFGDVKISGKTVYDFLKKNNIYAEIYDGYKVLFYLSMFTVKNDLNKLKNALLKMLKYNLQKEDGATDKGPFTYGE